MLERMRTRSLASQPAILSAAFLITACSGGGGSDPDFQFRPDGQLSLSLIDAPVTDVSAIRLVIDRIRVKPQGERPILEFDFDPDLAVDLLTLTPDNAELLLDGKPVPAGAYDWVELDANAAFDGVADSYVVETLTGGQVEIEVPSGSVRLVSGFTVTADQETSFTIDWNARMGLTRPPGRPGYLLRPAFRIIDQTDFGRLSGMVTMSLITPATPENQCDADSPAQNPDTGNAVYVFAGFDAIPDDIDGLDEADDPNADPVATIDVAQGGSADYRYSTIISPGDYTVAFTCQAGLDDPDFDDEILFSNTINVTITNGEETIADF